MHLDFTRATECLALDKARKCFAYSQRFGDKIATGSKTLLRIPPGWSYRDAAGVYVTAPTSYAALVNRAKIKHGDVCLILAAAGGVGIMAVQIAKAFGATVIAACSPAKFSVAKSFGADMVVDYNQPKWYDEIKRMTGGKGVNIAYDRKLFYYN